MNMGPSWFNTLVWPEPPWRTTVLMSPISKSAVGMNCISLLREPRMRSHEPRHYPTNAPRVTEPTLQKRENDSYPRLRKLSDVTREDAYIHSCTRRVLPPMSNRTLLRFIWRVKAVPKDQSLQEGCPSYGSRLHRLDSGLEIVRSGCHAYATVKSFFESRHGNVSYEGLMSPKKSVVFPTRSFLVIIHNNIVVDAAFPPILPGRVGTALISGEQIAGSIVDPPLRGPVHRAGYVAISILDFCST
ncbi:uncharacterized protein ARMOST_14442 [Armillaria ostoyae]|uniref:Uncharacterized protein n=1 Tax=Armillaria ostoyae TaxID=47428 RepID=A0A284RQL1_ARMOS|nr:uncharacterized protein ARMOST_14442 [Armillaria ostoyae]